jgi:dihydrofolate synthase/folylpolyglutamate synthase
MNYSEAMDYINSRSRFGIKLGLGRISALLEEMGNPQQQLRFIHVAGTNGKGSVSTMLSNVLIQGGCRTGLFISPYVLCFRERMQINGEMISEGEFAQCASYVSLCAKKLTVLAEEIETAIAFEWYRRRQCDFVCLEVGLGGRFDSTNIIPPPMLQVITSIGLDHTAILGKTLKEIAFEKAGIIKGGTTILYPIQSDEVCQVIESACEERESALIKADLSSLTITKEHWLDTEFFYNGVKYKKSLAGKFQIYNCITVIEAAKQLRNSGIAISDRDIQYAIEHTYFPARMEMLSQNPLIILDGSHNPDGAKALEETLRELTVHPLTIMMGILQDKDYNEILQTVGKYADQFIAVTPNNPRAMHAEDLKHQAEKLCKQVRSYENLHMAVHEVLRELPKGAGLIVCGSLYLASEIRPIVMEELDNVVIG